MRLFLGMVLIALGAAGAVATDRFFLEPVADTGVPAPVPETEPQPDDPPLVWIGGSLEEVGDRDLILRDGEGPRVEVGRFAGGATRIYRVSGGSWEELPPDARVDPGQEACVEAILDGESFLAVRVFLGTACGPT